MIEKSLLINPTADEKFAVQEYLKDKIDLDLVLFVYNNDKNITWLLNVASTYLYSSSQSGLVRSWLDKSMSANLL